MKTMGAKNTADSRRVRGPMLAAVMLVAAFMGAPRLAGQDTWSKWNYGLQLGALIPTGEKLKTVGESGVGLGGYAEITWSNGWALRGRGEYTAFGEKSFGSGVKTNVTQIGGMLDVIYYSRDSNLYPFVGVGYFSRSFKLNVGEFNAPMAVPSSPAMSIGGGWNFTNHLGLEVKYSFSTDDMPWVQASFLYRF